MVLCDNLDGRGGGGGKAQEGVYVYVYIYIWLICIVVQQKPTQYCKAIILQLKRKGKKSLQTTNARKGVEKRETSYTADWNINGYNHYGEKYGGSLKAKNKATI